MVENELYIFIVMKNIIYILRAISLSYDIDGGLWPHKFIYESLFYALFHYPTPGTQDREHDKSLIPVKVSENT